MAFCCVYFEYSLRHVVRVIGGPRVHGLVLHVAEADGLHAGLVHFEKQVGHEVGDGHEQQQRGVEVAHVHQHRVAVVALGPG